MPRAVSAAGTPRRRSRPSRNGPSSRKPTGAGSIRMSKCSAAPRHLAQFNVARVKYPLDDPRMAEFVDNVARVNALAEQIDGFVWRLQDDSGNAMGMQVYGDPRILPNLTVWENVGALERFVWKTVHSRFFGRRAEWFEHTDTPLVLWHVAAGHKPAMAE